MSSVKRSWKDENTEPSGIHRKHIEAWQLVKKVHRVATCKTGITPWRPFHRFVCEQETLTSCLNVIPTSMANPSRTVRSYGQTTGLRQLESWRCGQPTLIRVWCDFKLHDYPQFSSDFYASVYSYNWVIMAVNGRLGYLNWGCLPPPLPGNTIH